MLISAPFKVYTKTNLPAVHESQHRSLVTYQTTRAYIADSPVQEEIRVYNTMASSYFHLLHFTIHPCEAITYKHGYSTCMSE